ncbi:TPA: hypothetical protein ACP7SH_000873 [Escherichia coli]
MAEFTKEQLIEELERRLAVTTHYPDFEEAQLDAQIFKIALEALTAGMEQEPVAWAHRLINKRNGVVHPWVYGSAEACPSEWDIFNIEVMPLYTAPPAQVVPENYVTAEHRRVIEMLLNVCGAAFELADDSCQQEVDGEECHVVPDDAFQKLSDALDEIENTLPTEDVDRPDVFLAWSAMPRAALKSILQAGNSPVTPDDVLRMDWLVSKTVDVREPMVYGSHSIFWSQTITDEDDDYHATKLREQIDAAMAAEQAAAPQQENV